MGEEKSGEKEQGRPGNRCECWMWVWNMLRSGETGRKGVGLTPSETKRYNIIKKSIKRNRLIKLKKKKKTATEDPKKTLPTVILRSLAGQDFFVS